MMFHIDCVDLDRMLETMSGNRIQSRLGPYRDAILRLAPRGAELPEDSTSTLGALGNQDRLITIRGHHRAAVCAEELARPARRGQGCRCSIACGRRCACVRREFVVGEVRGPEVHAVLKAWGTGHSGGMATVHANSAIEGLGRLESLRVESAEGRSMPHEFCCSLIAEAVDVVVFIDEEPNIPAGRKVREVLLVSGYRDGEYWSSRYRFPNWGPAPGCLFCHASPRCGSQVRFSPPAGGGGSHVEVIRYERAICEVVKLLESVDVRRAREHDADIFGGVEARAITFDLLQLEQEFEQSEPELYAIANEIERYLPVDDNGI